MKSGNSVDSSEVEPAFGVPVVGHGVELVIGYAIAFEKSLYLSGSLVKAHQPEVAGQPKEALGIFINGVDIAVGEAFFFGVFPGGAGLGVPAYQAGPFGGHPEQAIAVLVEVFYALVGKFSGGRQPFALYAQMPVELVQPLVSACPKPFRVGVQAIYLHPFQPGQMSRRRGVPDEVQPLVRPGEHAV